MGEARVGKTLGNFRILECLGSGGSGMIWKAEDLGLGRSVALKALRAELASDADMAQRFREEARTLARLSHPNVASLYSFFEDDGGLYLVLEYVEGNTLAALLAKTGSLPLETAFALFHQVLDGVGHAHEAGVVHRDLKPSNLMVDARGRVKVMDFGIARVAGAARTTHHGKLVGTPEYMSPEQVRGEDPTLRSDIYSLGIVLFEMLTGQPPFRSNASFELMRAQIEQPPPDPRSLRPELDERIAAAILRALAKRPADRFSSTRELQETLLGAGAARHGRIPASLWRDLPRGDAASEAPTLANADAIALQAATRRIAAQQEATRGARVSEPAPPRATEPLDAWQRAVDALDDEIDAGSGEGATQRALAPATVVLDVTQDTEHLDAPRRSHATEEDASLGAHAKSHAAVEGVLSSTIRTRGRAIAAALAIAIVAVAVGVVRLRRPASVEASPAAQPDTAVAHEAARAAAPTRMPLGDARTPPMPALAAPASTAPAAARAERSAGPTARASAVKRPAPAPATTAATKHEQDAPPADDGWVIRR